MLPNKLKDLRGVVLACLGAVEAAYLSFSVHELAEICIYYRGKGIHNTQKHKYLSVYIIR